MHNRKWHELAAVIYCSWISRHRAPIYASVDDEFNKPVILKAFNARNIHFKQRPDRRQNKVGIVEKKNMPLKAIMELVKNAGPTDAGPVKIQKALLLHLCSRARER